MNEWMNEWTKAWVGKQASELVIKLINEAIINCVSAFVENG